jgi:galactan 5-O-arabinofuranosyltransferase
VMTLCRVNLAFKTFEVISLVVFMPWALYYVAGLRLRMVDGVAAWETATLQRRDWIIGGLIGGLVFMTYYYYFFLLIVWLPIQLLVDLRAGGWRGAWAKYRPMALMGLVMMAVSAVYWAPLMSDLLRFGMHSYQNRWFQPHMYGLPFDVINNWKGLLGIVGLLALAPSNKLARGILVMLIALLGYQLVGHLGIYRTFPLLHVRMVGMEEHLIQVGLILGGLKLLSLVRDFTGSVWEKGLAVAFATVYAISISMMYTYEINDNNTNLARDYRQPDLLGIEGFNAMAKDKVFLTNRLDLAALRPLYLFICPNAHYTHPASRYRERVKLLTLLQYSKDADFIAWMLQFNKYNRVDYVILDNGHLDIFDDNFPDWPNHRQVPIQFDSTAFRGPYFSTHPKFGEVQVAGEVPEALWKGFDPGQMRLAALFTDIPELRATIPAAEMKALEDEIRIQTKDYETWKRVFWWRWLQWK